MSKGQLEKAPLSVGSGAFLHIRKSFLHIKWVFYMQKNAGSKGFLIKLSPNCLHL